MRETENAYLFLAETEWAAGREAGARSALARATVGARPVRGAFEGLTRADQREHEFDEDCSHIRNDEAHAQGSIPPPGASEIVAAIQSRSGITLSTPLLAQFREVGHRPRRAIEHANEWNDRDDERR
jgi:hypothetical protein